MWFIHLFNVKQIALTKSTNHFIFANNCLRFYNLQVSGVISKNISQTHLNNAVNKNYRHFSLLSCHKRMQSLVSTFDSHKLVRVRYFTTAAQRLRDKNHFDKQEFEILLKKYPQPKSVLHNYYAIVSSELKSPSYNVNPQFKVSPQKKGENSREWTCSYNIKWPQETKIIETATTKADASKKAALRVLYMLHQSGKILDNGQPIMYDREHFQKVTKKTYHPLVLDNFVETKLNSISQIFESELRPHIEKSYQNQEINEDGDSSIISNDSSFKGWSLNQQRNRRNDQLSMYFAKESVKLPIQQHRKEFEGLLDKNRIIIIRGEPGCGKSTRIPQYVLDHWVSTMGSEPIKIIVTQPRRIAAISLAERVAEERQERLGNIVGYQVRLRSIFNPQTGRILYCTTGILLRQLQADASLSECTHVIIDEAHERDVNTDLLMNLLRHALVLNSNLKIIVMSATIDVALFQSYFNNAPVMNIPGFTYPVKVNFLEDIKVKLPRTMDMCENLSPIVILDDIAKIINWIDANKSEGAILCFLPGWDEISKIRQLLLRQLNPNRSLVLALHSKLSDEDQRKIFNRPPPGVRKVILATNIAETSVTIDDVVYVVDTGIHKETRFDMDRGIMSMDNHWISQSSMSQRKGRAGRVQAGESFHLYPRRKYDSMIKFSVPEILRVSLTKIVLDAKVYSHNMDAIEFFNQLPCPPEDGVILRAIDELTDLELLDENEKLTPFGRIISEFQLAPKISKAMVQSMIYKCVTPIVDIATIFTSESDMFSGSLLDKPAIKNIKTKRCKTSDHISMMILFEQWANLIRDQDLQEAAMYCTRNNLIPHKLNTMLKLQDIHCEYLGKYLKNIMLLSDDFSDNEEIIKGVLLSGVGTVLMHRKWDIVKGRLKNADVFITGNGQRATITQESVNSKKTDFKSPFFVYINETRSVIRRTTLIRETSLVTPLTLLLFKNRDLQIQEPMENKDESIRDGVILQLAGTKFVFYCNRKQAHTIKKCKQAMREMENYFVHQLTEGGEQNLEIQKNWDAILQTLNEVLKPEKI